MKRRRRAKNPEAKRNQSTRAGRRDGPDRGVAKVRRERLLATGSESLPVDPLGVLLGRGMIDLGAYNAGRDIGELLETVRIGLVGNAGSVQGSWLAILTGGAIRGQAASVSSAAEHALRKIAKIRQAIGNAETAGVVFAVCGGSWEPFVLTILLDRKNFGHGLKLLRAGLDRVARTWSRDPVGLTPGATALTVHA
jgi:hypothetical protein